MRKASTKKLKKSWCGYFFVETKTLSVQYFALTELHAFRKFVLEYGSASNEELVVRRNSPHIMHSDITQKYNPWPNNGWVKPGGSSDDKIELSYIDRGSRLNKI